MRIKANSRREIGRLFACMGYGERIAHACARRQAGITTDPGTCRFLLRQARQEAHHGRVFARVASCVAPRGPEHLPVALQRFEAQLEAACRRGDFVETLVGQQIVLESFGDLILQRMNRKLDQRRIGFKRLRRTIMHQEQGHRAFGDRTLSGLVAAGDTSDRRVCELADEYLFLLDRALDELQPLFDVVGASAGLYKSELRAGLPPWIRAS